MQYSSDNRFAFQSDFSKNLLCVMIDLSQTRHLADFPAWLSLVFFIKLAVRNIFRYFLTCLDLSQFYQLAPGELFHRVSDMTSRLPSKRTSHTDDDHIFVAMIIILQIMMIFYDDTLLSDDHHGDMKSQMPQSTCTSHTC